MSDNLRRYRALRDACAPWYPGQPSSTVARYLRTLAALISGIVGSTSTPLLHIAAQVPNGTTPESRVKRVARWCDNAHLRAERYVLPSADAWRRYLAWQTLGLVIDGRDVGRGGPALMLHGVAQGRALPPAWRVVVGAQLFAVVRLTIDPFSWAAVPCMAVHGVRQRVEPQPDGTYGIGGPSRVAGFSEERGGRDARRAPYYLG